MEVCKEIWISTAHMLTGHVGLCQNLHGHNYKVCVSVHAEEKERDRAGSSARMVIDFIDLKEAIRSEIESKFDHAVVFSGSDYRGEAESELLDWANKWKMRCVVMPHDMRTTAEDMSLFFAKLLARKLKAVVEVKIWETEHSVASSGPVAIIE